MISATRLLRALLLSCLPLAAAGAQYAVLRGTVTDSLRRAPLAGARVTATRAVPQDSASLRHEFSGTTDINGRFEITSLVPAIYLVTVDHPWLDTTGFEIPPQTVDMRDRQNATVSLGLPSGATIRAAFCPAIARDSTLGLVEGVVRDAMDDRPLGAVRVVFAWTDITANKLTGRASQIHRTIAANTALDGSFAACGLPVATTFLMQAQIAERATTGAIEVEIPASGVLVEMFRIAKDTTVKAVIAGTVRHSGSMLPVSGARVHVFGTTGEVVTTAEGTFRLNEVPVGTQSIEVTALGLHPRRYPIDVRVQGATGVSIALNSVGTVLDTVKTITKRATANALRDEFDQRIGKGAGQYITEDMIERYHPWQTTDLIRTVRGFKLMADTVISSRGILEVGGNNYCKPVLLIDGNPADSMNEILPVSIHGIEIYPSSIGVPLRYPSSDCGTILIWTK